MTRCARPGPAKRSSRPLRDAQRQMKAQPLQPKEPQLKPGMVVEIPRLEFTTLPAAERVTLVRCISRRTDEWLVSIAGDPCLQRRTVSAVMTFTPHEVLRALRLLWRTGTVMPALLWSPVDDRADRQGKASLHCAALPNAQNAPNQGVGAKRRPRGLTPLSGGQPPKPQPQKPKPHT